MYKVAVVGIDNSGKTSVVNSLGGIEGVNTIHLTTCNGNGSKIARFSGSVVSNFARFGESRELRCFTGFSYFMHLFPYFFEERAKSSSSVLVSDRDPLIDTLCYSSCYLPRDFSRTLRPALKSLLEQYFSYPSSVFYLDTSPDVSVNRNNKPVQLHDKVNLLSRLSELFHEEIFLVEKRGIPVHRIDTDAKPLEEVISEVRHKVKRLL